ncbi:hypothetical protein AVEN_41109-1 [Araneus ventricosus]|uniref:Uncharacterized protein n=1 Tax=Araneus ventricosus TaxID=182803 RepID=A0A4Y2E9D8_ARAVE|nr:hypothetical protein AVEN_41109-1 [Araneus ventricosus]
MPFVPVGLVEVQFLSRLVPTLMTLKDNILRALENVVYRIQCVVHEKGGHNEGGLVIRCNLYASPGPANAATELLMTGNKLPGLTSLVSNCIGWMDMYWYGDNLMNPWTRHVNRELFNLVEHLWSYGAFAVGLIWDL